MGNLSIKSSPAVGDDVSQLELLWGMLEVEMEDAGGGGFIFAGKWNSSHRGDESEVWPCSLFSRRSVITFLMYCKTLELTA